MREAIHELDHARDPPRPRQAGFERWVRAKIGC